MALSVGESSVGGMGTRNNPSLNNESKLSEQQKLSVSNARQLVLNQEALLTTLQKLRKELNTLDWEASSLKYDVQHYTRLPDPVYHSTCLSKTVLPEPTRLGSKPPSGTTRERGRSTTRRNSFSSGTRTLSRSRSVSRATSAFDFLSENNVHGTPCAQRDEPEECNFQRNHISSITGTQPTQTGVGKESSIRRSRSSRRITLTGGVQTDILTTGVPEKGVPQIPINDTKQTTDSNGSQPAPVTSSPRSGSKDVQRSTRWLYTDEIE